MANTRSFKPKTSTASETEEMVGAPMNSGSENSAPQAPSESSDRGEAPRRD